MNGLNDWAALHRLNYTPNFKPGKRFMKETFADISNTMLGGAGNVLHDPDGDSSGDNYAGSAQHRALENAHNGNYLQDDSADGTGGVLTEEQRVSFRGFRYTSEHFQKMFRNQETPYSTRTITSVGAESTTSASMAGTSTSSGKHNTRMSVV